DLAKTMIGPRRYDHPLASGLRLLSADIEGANAILEAGRRDLIDGDGLNELLDRIERELNGLAPRRLHATRNIVLELAANVLIHAPRPCENPELLLLTRRHDMVAVWMFGSGRSTQIQRLTRIIASIRYIAEPPGHCEELLRRRNHALLRKSALP